MQTNQVRLKINGVMTVVRIPEGMKPAHGTGLNGKKEVKSLLLGTSPEFPGKTFGRDAHGNDFVTDADEFFVATKHAAPSHKISAVKKAS